MANIDLATPPAGTGPTTTQASGIRTSLGLGTLATGSPGGTANATTFLRGDLSWAAVAAGSSDPIPLVSSFYY